MNASKFFLVLAVLTLGLLSASCSDEDTTLDSIKIEPHYWETNIGANSRQFSAVGHYSDGETKNLTHEAAWSSTLPVSGGMVIFNQSGNFTVSASHSSDSSSGSIVGTASIKVNSAIQLLEISPGDFETTLGAESKQLQAIGTYDDDVTIDLTDYVVWSDDASPNLLSASVPGLLLFHSAQETPFQITAVYADGTSYELTRSISVTVKKALKSIEITPDDYTASILDLSSDGYNYDVTADTSPGQFYAIGTYTDDTTSDLTNEATWTDDSVSGSILSPILDGMIYFDTVGRFVVIVYVDQTSDRISDKIILNIIER